MNKFKSLLAKFWKLAPSLIFVFALCAIFSDATFAAMDPSAMNGAEEALGGLPVIPTAILGVIAYVVKLIAYLAYVFALFVGNLMDSSFILDSGMGNTLHQIWVVMRNFVNIAFIIVLLIIAVMVIFGGGGEKGLGMLKKVLPKFILALVLVNLTFFLARFVLTANDVLTTAIMTVPETIAPGETIYLTCSETGDSGECLKEVAEGLSLDFKNKQISLDSVMKYLTKLHEHKMEGSIDKKNIALVLTTRMLDLENLIKIKALSGNWDAFLGAIGAIVVAVVVGLVIFMLFLALMVRMVVLWIAIALSPLAALAMVLGEVIPGLNTKSDFDLLGIFLKHAFMPAMISLPLVIGLVMIFANNAIGYNVSLNTFFSFSGDSAADNLFSLLWWIASIIVIWYGTNMMIKKSSDYASKLTEKVHSGVNKFVGGAASTLQYVPFLPSPAGGDISARGIIRQPEIFQAHLREKSQKSAQNLAAWGGYGSEHAEARIAVDTYLSHHDGDNLKKLLNTEDGKKGVDYLMNNREKDADARRKQFIEIHGGTVAEGVVVNPEKFAELLRDENIHLAKSIGGIFEGKEMWRALEKAMNKKKSPEEAKKSIVSQTNIDSKIAGERVGENKVDAAEQKGVTFNNRPIFKKDDTYYFADDDKDTKRGAVKLFTEEEKKRSFDDTINTLDNEVDKDKAGIALANVLDQLSKFKGLLSLEQETNINGQIQKMFESDLIHKNHINDLKTSYKKLFGSTKLIDDLEKNPPEIKNSPRV